MPVYFSEDHEWISVDGDVGTIGITDYAQSQLGDVVFVELPEVGRSVEKGGEMAVIESVKAASEVYAPVSGEVIEANDVLSDAPEKINAEAESGAWIVKIKLASAEEVEGLMDAAGYKAFVETL